MTLRLERRTKCRHKYSAAGLLISTFALLSACAAPAPTPTPNPADFFPISNAQITLTPLGVRMAAQTAFIASDPGIYGLTDRPQIVAFYSGDCANCLAARTPLGELNDEYQQVADFLYINMDDSRGMALATQLSVQKAQLPVVLYFDPDSILVERLNSVTDKATLRAGVEKAITVG